MGRVELEDVAGAIDALLGELSLSLDAVAWGRVEELVRLLTDLYGAGLARTIEVADDQALVTTLGRDALVAPLLALHGLHPDPLEARALAGVRAAVAALAPGGARARLTEVDDAAATVRVTVTGHGSPGAASRWEALVRGAIGETAPEATVEVVVREPPASPTPPPASAAEGAPVAVSLGPTRAGAAVP